LVRIANLTAARACREVRCKLLIILKFFQNTPKLASCKNQSVYECFEMRDSRIRITLSRDAHEDGILLENCYRMTVYTELGGLPPSMITPDV
jgi:hypothetical protein